jgi:surfeit locus 1 family protein
VKARRLLVPAVSTVVMLVILVSLGVWQLHRLAWKTDILARIDAAEQAPGVPLGATPLPYAKVSVRGVWGDKSTLYGAEGRDEPGRSVLGAHLLTPLLREGATPLLVDRGWVDTAAPLPATPGGVVTVEGYIHPADHPHWFSPTDDAPRRFYTLDPATIGKALGLSAEEPFTLIAMGPPGNPEPARALPRPPNDHLQYALTWFAFALTLLVIFAIYARGILRS